MENKINVAELLKDCPKGMELDCTMFENLEFERVNKDDKVYPIICRVKTEWGSYNFHSFNIYGCYSNEKYSKCIIFPKGKTTWEGFQRPFKDGDILATDLGSVFFLNMRHNTDEYYGCYVGIGGDSSFHICEPFAYKECCGLATKEEKAKLFKAIRDKGYKWDTKTKTLEELIKPKFRVGDRVQNKNTNMIGTINLIINDECEYQVALKNGGITYILFEFQDSWELVPNKFDITTLKPFDKVLVRDGNKDKWNISFYGFYDIKYDINYPYECCGNSFAQCIPYNGNEHLLGTTDDCDEFYQNW